MNTPVWIICSLAAFDALIVALLFLLLRSQPLMDRKARMVTAIGLSGFVFHAFMFFDGAILYLQLGTLALFYVALAFMPFQQRSAGRVRDNP